VSDSEAMDGFAQLANPFRRELVAHCYRLIGSLEDAEDLVQETLLRAWRSYEAFDGRSSLRTWLYRIATNACLTALTIKHRRELPSTMGEPITDIESSSFARIDSTPWLGPAPTMLLTDRPDDPASIVGVRDSTRLALIAAFQRLPARQRAALILVDVAGFAPAEAAESLGITVTAARSLVQRARASLDADRPIQEQVVVSPNMDSEILEQYIRAFQFGDIPLLAGLLRSDVEYEMPPIQTWILGREAVLNLHTRSVFHTAHLAVPTSANGFPAAASYTELSTGEFEAQGIHVLEIMDNHIARVTLFLDKELFPRFGLPMILRRPSGNR
jgi:RNA polymerase sigma-70 factor, ECF subfamily